MNKAISLASCCGTSPLPKLKEAADLAGVFRALADEARARLQRLGYGGVQVRHGDGYAGWPEAAPFDAIVVTAGADSIPLPLVRQLAPGGRLVMPVGDPWIDQRLVLLEKDSSGRIASRDLLPVRFVPLLRGER